MIIFCDRWWLPRYYAAITFWPFIFIRRRTNITNATLIHELIHIEQQKELLVFFSFIWYIVEYLIKLVYYRNAEKAYRNVSFEREAYNHCLEPNYLDNRKRYSFLRYVYVK